MTGDDRDFYGEPLDDLAALLEMAKAITEEGDAVYSQALSLARAEAFDEQNPAALRIIAERLLPAVVRFFDSGGAEWVQEQAEGLQGEIEAFLSGAQR